MWDTAPNPDDSPLTEQLRQSLAGAGLKAPSLPDVALQIGMASREDDLSTPQLATIIGRDPATAIRVISVANMVGVRGAGREVTTLPAAVTRIGLESTRILARCTAMEHLFVAKRPHLAELMRRIWRHSIETAAFTRALSEETGRFDPDTALMLGLMSQIGTLPVIACLDRRPDFDPCSADQIEDATFDLQAGIGERVLREWDLPAPMITAVGQCWNMTRDGDTATLADLATVAFWHTCPAGHRMRLRQPLETVTAFGRLGLPTTLVQDEHPALWAANARALLRLGG